MEGVVRSGGEAVALTWNGSGEPLGRAPEGARRMRIDRLAATGCAIFLGVARRLTGASLQSLLQWLARRLECRPRYLVPAVPFLALPIARAAGTAFRPTLVLGVWSAVAMAILVAVDPQAPVGSDAIAARPDRPRLLGELPGRRASLALVLLAVGAPLLAALREARPTR